MKMLLATLVVAATAGLTSPTIACEGQTKTTTAKAADCGTSCLGERMALHLAAALTELDASSAAAKEIRSAMALLVQSKPELKTRFASVMTVSNADCASSCDGTKQTLKMTKLVAGKTATCSEMSKAKAVLASGSTCSTTAKATKVASADCASSCESGAKPVVKLVSNSPDSCGDKTKAVLAKAASCSSKTAATKVASADCASSCESGVKSTNARYVAYGCESSDRIARVAARAYLEMLVELKGLGEADGCPMEAARDTLASVIDEMMAERMASDEAKADTLAVNKN